MKSISSSRNARGSALRELGGGWSRLPDLGASQLGLDGVDVFWSALGVRLHQVTRFPVSNRREQGMTCRTHELGVREADNLVLRSIKSGTVQ